MRAQVLKHLSKAEKDKRRGRRRYQKRSDCRRNDVEEWGCQSHWGKGGRRRWLNQILSSHGGLKYLFSFKGAVEVPHRRELSGGREGRRRKKCFFIKFGVFAKRKVNKKEFFCWLLYILLASSAKFACRAPSSSIGVKKISLMTSYEKATKGHYFSPQIVLVL